jgi:2-keto-3-deoxy-6-phosphogluconate aldolase
MAGALTPTEVVAAWQAGADLVKIFPCGLVGGAKYIKALKGPFPQIEFIPTGGVNLETTPEFIKAGAAAVAVGGELVDLKALREGKLRRGLPSRSKGPCARRGRTSLCGWVFWGSAPSPLGSSLARYT